MAEVDVKNKRIFCRSSHPAVFCKKRPLQYLAELAGKHVHKGLKKFERKNFKKNYNVSLQLYLKRGSCIGFFCEIFRTLQNSFFIVQSWIAACDLIEYLETLIIIWDLRKCLKILSITVDFMKNIWNFGVAMKRSEHCI